MKSQCWANQWEHFPQKTNLQAVATRLLELYRKVEGDEIQRIAYQKLIQEHCHSFEDYISRKETALREWKGEEADIESDEYREAFIKGLREIYLRKVTKKLTSSPLSEIIKVLRRYETDNAKLISILDAQKIENGEHQQKQNNTPQQTQSKPQH